jgi:hypothetical protein
VGLHQTVSWLWAFAAAHQQGLLIAAGIVIVLILLDLFWLANFGPEDVVSNGIAIGRPKAFDNRSLSLKIETLNDRLDALRVLNQNLADGLGKYQGVSSSADKLDAQGGSSKPKDAPAKDDKAASDGQDFKAPVGSSAGDTLSDQLNLESQIVNLRTLYERSLSDRLLGDNPRLQVVLGFQISITTPHGFEDSAAITEIAVRMHDTGDPVSLVALMPQEKTYNTEVISSSEKSFSGSAVARVVPLSVSGGRSTKNLFVHRDSDTVALERDPRDQPQFFGDDRPASVIFGWEFRPVLGRRTVSPGTRQMFAVLALPEADTDLAKESSIEVQTRSYWRAFSRSAQSTRGKFSLLPWRSDFSGRVDSEAIAVSIPNTARIQGALKPGITGIKWVDAGGGVATVLVAGRNFFPGTKVVVGGKEITESSGLVLKSDQALEVSTTMSALASGDAVLSGRFGPSMQLGVPAETLPVEGLFITQATIRFGRGKKYLQVRIIIAGLKDGNYSDLKVDHLAKGPEPLMFLGKQPVPLPYDYYDVEPTDFVSPPASATAPPSGNPAAQPKSVRVEAWVPVGLFAASDPFVTFKVPFCGSGWCTTVPFNVGEPVVQRLGGDQTVSVFRISQEMPFPSDVYVDLDQPYPAVQMSAGILGAVELVKIDDTDLRLTIPTALAARYKNVVLRYGKTDSVLLALPPEDKPVVRPSLDNSAKPAQLTKGAKGLVTWSGTALDSISKVTMDATELAFDAFENGNKLAVYFAGENTATPGKKTIVMESRIADPLKTALFIVEA